MLVNCVSNMAFKASISLSASSDAIQKTAEYDAGLFALWMAMDRFADVPDIQNGRTYTLLGEGRFGQTFLKTEVGTNRLVAVKVLSVFF